MRIKIEPRFWQFILGSGTVWVGVELYRYIQRHTIPVIPVLNKYDAAIPFWPWMIWVYLSIFPVFIVASFVLNKEKFRKTLVRVIIGHIFAYPCFFLLPIAYPRPELNGLWEIHIQVFTWLRSMDMAHNTLPSMHVAITWIIMHDLGKTSVRSVPGFTYAMIVSISVLLTKQHFIIDVFLGFAIYCIALILENLLLKHYDHFRHPERLVEDD